MSFEEPAPGSTHTTVYNSSTLHPDYGRANFHHADLYSISFDTHQSLYYKFSLQFYIINIPKTVEKRHSISFDLHDYVTIIHIY